MSAGAGRGAASALARFGARTPQLPHSGPLGSDVDRDLEFCAEACVQWIRGPKRREGSEPAR